MHKVGFEQTGTTSDIFGLEMKQRRAHFDVRWHAITASASTPVAKAPIAWFV
jgi:hypothetical protein